MKAVVSGGMVRALIALGLVSYHAVPALAVGQAANVGAQTQWVSQLIVKEKSGASSTYELQSAGTAVRVDVATVQRWSAAAQLPVTYKRAMSGGAHVVTLPQTMSVADAQAVAQRMESTGQFEYVSPDRVLRPAFTPSATWFSSQWNLMAKDATITTIPNASGPLQPASATAVGGANLTTAWNTTTGSNTINVAVVDTGILSHADISGATTHPGANFITNSFRNNSGDSIGTDPGDAITSTDITNNPTVCNGATPSKSSWHGTFVTGQIAAQHSGTRVAGIAPGVGMQMARALGRCGGAESDIIDAVTWASGGIVARMTPITNPTPAKVINMSLGGSGTCDAPMQSAITNARNRGTVVVVATGNESASSIDTPANCTGTIAVTAHTLEGDKASYANVGAGTTLSAPGGGNGSVVSGLGALIVSISNSGTTSPSTNSYSGEAGTSMATPHVAGVAALILSLPGKSTLTPAQVTTILQQSARPFPAGTYCATHAGVCGAGMLDAGDAVSVASGKPLVHASTSASSIIANNAVALTASGTPGFGSTTASVQWTQTSGPTASLTTAGPDTNGNYTATFTPTATGTYAFNVTWTNGAGGTATDSTQVSVAAAPASGGGTGGGSTGGGSTGGSTGGGTGTTTPATASSSGGGGGAIGLGGAALLLAAGLAGRRRRVK